MATCSKQQIGELCLRHADRAGATGAAARRNGFFGPDAEPAQCDRPVARAGTGRLQPVLDGTARVADRRLSVRRGRAVRRTAQRGRWRAGAGETGPAWRAARIAGFLDRGRDPADAKGDSRPARADGGGRGLRASAAAQRLPDRAAPRDYVDTEYAARLDRSTGAIAITAPPNGILGVGGYRFLSSDLQEWGRRLGQGALLTALPDRLSGHRLAGRAQDNARAREALSELGLNPLMVEAFRDRSPPPGA